MKLRRLTALCLLIALSLGMMSPGYALTTADVLDDTADYVQKMTPNPTVGSIGGEWAVFGLARGGYEVPDSYYDNVVSFVKACDGVLHRRKYTEYSRVVLALTAIGRDPANVGGYDLIAPLGDYDKTVWQGINGPIFALLALDSGNYSLPAGSTATRQKYVDCILAQEIHGGGWSLAGDTADVDITAMALQALAKYQDQAAVQMATERALAWLSGVQDASGGFSTMGEKNCESCAQVVVALCELGTALDDPRFVKNGRTALDALLAYYVKGSGFTHLSASGGGDDAMTTEQAFYALIAADRAARGESTLYRISSASTRPVVTVTFPDIKNHPNREAIELLASRQIINGMGNGTFSPNSTMTRAQFCTIVVKALGLTPKAVSVFLDVAGSSWYAPYVGTASVKGIVNGVGDGKFAPDGTITRQEAAVMVMRAAKVLGLDTHVDDAGEVLALLSDGRQVSSWAQNAVAYCCLSGILTPGKAFCPTQAILRGEIAQMICNMLDLAGEL